MRPLTRRAVTFVLIFFLWAQCVPPAAAYSVLTHEEIIDIAWATDLRPLIARRFPGITDAQMKEAHAYAYGGSIIQDLGYYPHGKHEFSDMLHYVRTGDFVRTLLRDSSNANEFAFALGALAHYTSDIVGHPAVNRAVAIEFPKLKEKYGDKVTYVQNKTAHIQTEFGFDMDQVAKHRYTQDNYHDFIGFKVATDLLERAFQETYGMKMEQVLPNRDKAIESYRHAVSNLIPRMTRVALRVRKDVVAKEYPTNARRQFLYNIRKTDYEKDFGTNYFKEDFKTKFLAFLLKILPKVGPMKALGFKVPTPATEDLYFKSINATVAQYQAELRRIDQKTFTLAQDDLDTGDAAQRGEYSLADDTYDALLAELSKSDFDGVSKELKTNILSFYAAASVPAPLGAAGQAGPGGPASPLREPVSAEKNKQDTQQLLMRLQSKTISGE